MHGVIEFHLEGLRFEGKPVPASKSEATYLMRNRRPLRALTFWWPLPSTGATRSMVHLRGWTASFNGLPQQRLYFLPLPQEHGSFRLGNLTLGSGSEVSRRKAKKREWPESPFSVPRTALSGPSG